MTEQDHARRDFGRQPDAVAVKAVRKNPPKCGWGNPNKANAFEHSLRPPALCNCEAEGTQAMRRVVIYLRVSTIEQTTANQERELREIAGRMGCEIVKVYKDHGISGTRGRDKRPAFDKLCRDAALREFDMVMAWSVDRLGRSLQDLVSFLSELHALKIDLFLRQQGLDTTTPAGKAMFQMLGVFAEFERAMIAERVRAGLARARGEGKRLGRPPIAPALEKRIREALATPGRPGVRVIAKEFGVDPGTVQRISRPFVAASAVADAVP
jgi:DNA invertase Pin-like site-specific DNA recombinase